MTTKTELKYKVTRDMIMSHELSNMSDRLVDGELNKKYFETFNKYLDNIYKDAEDTEPTLTQLEEFAKNFSLDPVFMEATTALMTDEALALNIPSSEIKQECVDALINHPYIINDTTGYDFMPLIDEMVEVVNSRRKDGSEPNQADVWIAMMTAISKCEYAHKRTAILYSRLSGVLDSDTVNEIFVRNNRSMQGISELKSALVLDSGLTKFMGLMLEMIKSDVKGPKVLRRNSGDTVVDRFYLVGHTIYRRFLFWDEEEIYAEAALCTAMMRNRKELDMTSLLEYLVLTNLEFLKLVQRVTVNKLHGEATEWTLHTFSEFNEEEKGYVDNVVRSIMS